MQLIAFEYLTPRDISNLIALFCVLVVGGFLIQWHELSKEDQDHPDDWDENSYH